MTIWVFHHARQLRLHHDNREHHAVVARHGHGAGRAALVLPFSVVIYQYLRQLRDVEVCSGRIDLVEVRHPMHKRLKINAPVQNPHQVLLLKVGGLVMFLLLSG